MDKAFADHILHCVQRGVQVTLVYRRARRDIRRTRSCAVAGHTGQAPDGPGQAPAEQQDSHAKVLVVDDEAMVTSFNFLSFDGYYGGVGRRRQRAEVGVRIFGGDVASRLLESFGAALDGPRRRTRPQHQARVPARQAAGCAH